MVQILSAACVLLCLVGVSGHTLVVCTDLSADRQTCNGYSRNVALYMNRGDGHVISADKSGPPCGDFNTLTDTSYSTTYPMATAAAGAKITIGWPSNNHQKANGAVPASGNSGDDNVQIYLSQVENPTRDILEKTPGAGAADLIGTPSYSNCFADYDKTLTSRSAGNENEKFFCTTELTMPAAAGTYTYVWAWKLGGFGFYYSCFDVNVGGSDARPPTAPTTAVEAPTNAPTPVPGSSGACSQFASDYCANAGFPGCYKDANNRQHCGVKKDTTPVDTSDADCPQIIKDFCANSYTGATCVPKGGNSYQCLKVGQAEVQDGEPEDKVDEVVDSIVSTSDIVKAAIAAEAALASSSTGEDVGSGACYSAVFNHAVLLLLGCTFFAFAPAQ